MSDNPSALREIDMDNVDTFEAALLGLTAMVAENREMLQAIIKHLDVPYKRPAGFIKE